MFRVLFAFAVAVAVIQSPEPYDLLSPRGQELFPSDAVAYNQLEQSKRTTFHAIIHALEAVGLDHLIVSVDRIWGALPSSTEGRDQYRLSVTLAKGGVDELRSRDDFDKDRVGHVKRADGRLVGGIGWRNLFVGGLIQAARATDSVRQKRSDLSPASLQISWLEDEPTVGDIDIDYVRKRDIVRHNSPRNSDVTFQFPGGETHYLLHSRTFSGLPEWWRRP